MQTGLLKPALFAWLETALKYKQGQNLKKMALPKVTFE